tara:strand:+ start:7221 stop:7784 length:564 start_codon:yes stop_codon:yes gene_type:complete
MDDKDNSHLSSEDFAVLYSQTHLSLLRYVMTLIPNRAQAEDVVQETARALWKKSSEYDPELPFWPWAKKFAYFEVLRHRKRQAIRGKYFFSDELIETLAEERDHAEPVLEEQRAILSQCLEKLDGRARELIVQRYSRERTLDEIAREQNRSANSLYLMMHRIRKKLIECVNRALHASEWETKFPKPS